MALNELAPAPPEQANYKNSTNAEQSCNTCIHFSTGTCNYWNATVSGEMVCDSFDKGSDPESNDLDRVDNDRQTSSEFEMSELFLPGSQTGFSEEDDGLIWKTVLRTGVWALTPGAGQKPVTKPLKVVRDNAKEGEIALSDILNSFEDGAVEHVTVPLSHTDRVDENTGFAKKLRIIDGTDGSSLLQAGLFFTDPSIKVKVLEGSIANTSVGLIFDYPRKRDGKKYKVAMQHTALTNRPWIDGMEPFGIAASEVVSGTSNLITSLQFTTEEEDPAGEEEPEETAAAPTDQELAWHENASFSFRQKAIEVAIEAMDSVDYTILDLTDSVALVKDDEGKRWIVEYDMTDGDVNIGERAIYDHHEHTDQPEEEVNASEETLTFDLTPLERVQFERKFRHKTNFGDNKETPGGGEQMGETNKLELSDDAKELFEQQKDEIAKLRTQVQSNEVRDYVEGLKKIGFDQFPGVLKEVRQIMMSDDGGPALLLSEEEGKAKVEQTSSQIVRRIIDAFPLKDGKLEFAEQATFVPNDEKPDEDASKELSQDEKTALAEKFLEITNTSKGGE